MIISPHNYVFFTLEKKFEDKIKLGDMELDIIPSEKPGEQYQYLREYGEVIAIPLHLHYSLKTTMDVKIGDRIYFHHLTTKPDNLAPLKTENGQDIYKAPYNAIYCSIRDEKIIMMNHFVFCEPVMESEDACKSETGLFLKSKPDPIPLQAIIRHMPPYKESNWEGWPIFKLGDKIMYSKNSDCPVTVEGHKYYRMKVDDIMGVFE